MEIGNKLLRKSNDSRFCLFTEEHLSGILVKRDFKYHIFSANDLSSKFSLAQIAPLKILSSFENLVLCSFENCLLQSRSSINFSLCISEYTDMSMSVITQRQSIAFNGNVIGLKILLERIGGAGTVEEIEPDLKYKVFDSVTITISGKVLIMEWEATPITDMYADTVLASLMQTELAGNTLVRSTHAGEKNDRKHFEDCLVDTLQDMFGKNSVPTTIDGDNLPVKIDDKHADINLATLVCMV